MILNYMWSPEMTQKISELYESLPNRMQAVIAAHGGNAMCRGRRSWSGMEVKFKEENIQYSSFHVFAIHY
ncbi:hypothetical protein EON65_38930 [archaeon]|nr:MAG: hypothetical protein EON65_38930 [archaeon]